jgi:hypothetical protein
MPTQEQYEQSDYGKEEQRRIDEHFSEFLKKIPVHNPLGKWPAIANEPEQTEGGGEK